MDLLKVINERKSIRAFKPDPIPRERIEEILNLTSILPSAINLQPWEFVGYRIAQKLDVPVPEFKVTKLLNSMSTSLASASALALVLALALAPATRA